MVFAAGDQFSAEEVDAVCVADFEGAHGFGVVGPGDDDLADIFVCVEEFDGALEDGFSGEVFVEFGSGHAEQVGVAVGAVERLIEAGGGAGGGDDDGDFHANLCWGLPVPAGLGWNMIVDT